MPESQGPTDKLARMLRHLSLLLHHQNADHSRIASSARRRDLLSDDVILLHGNAMPHSGRVTQQHIDSFCREQKNHRHIVLTWHQVSFTYSCA
ncbi:hypothetical protein AVEN_46133-1 [Araneus ventricosus]|uniref:Uncharacterized protein n=1 Tax=Araneus ventricosus TaxID=182803 RepID=A0A4Y2D782_ARAVE|nr:hypothetical protein AVEN_46133-1 [Araneus ventricosus]